MTILNCSLMSWPSLQSSFSFILLTSTSFSAEGMKTEILSTSSAMISNGSANPHIRGCIRSPQAHCRQPTHRPRSRAVDQVVLPVPSLSFPRPKLSPSCLPTLHVLTFLKKDLGRMNALWKAKLIVSFHLSRITPSFKRSLLKLVGAENHNIPAAPRKGPRCRNSKPPKLLFLATPWKIVTPTAGYQGKRNTLR